MKNESIAFMKQFHDDKSEMYKKQDVIPLSTAF